MYEYKLVILSPYRMEYNAVALRVFMIMLTIDVIIQHLSTSYITEVLFVMSITLLILLTAV